MARNTAENISQAHRFCRDATLKGAGAELADAPAAPATSCATWAGVMQPTLCRDAQLALGVPGHGSENRELDKKIRTMTLLYDSEDEHT